MLSQILWVDGIFQNSKVNIFAEIEIEKKGKKKKKRFNLQKNYSNLFQTNEL